ncbi:MAG: hypothetical protein ACRDG7_02200 [Candidatus Limnocylindria bacterium]
MKRTSLLPSHAMPDPAETLTMRMAVSADAPALRRLAQLDSARPPERAPMLVAEVCGELCAALPLDGGPAIANPFRRTAEVVALLVERVQQLEEPTLRAATRRWRPVRALQPAPGPHA